jgi:hypothetical protein
VRLIIILALSSCAGARVIDATPVGGTLELHGNRARAKKRATEKMLAHCGSADATITKAGDEHGDYIVHYHCNAT